MAAVLCPNTAAIRSILTLPFPFLLPLIYSCTSPFLVSIPAAIDLFMHFPISRFHSCCRLLHSHSFSSSTLPYTAATSYITAPRLHSYIPVLSRLYRLKSLYSPLLTLFTISLYMPFLTLYIVRYASYLTLLYIIYLSLYI